MLTLYGELLATLPTRDADHHLLTATERDLLMAMEGSRAQPARTADDRPDPCALAAAKIPPNRVPAPAPMTVCSMLFRPLLLDSIAPSTSTFSPEGAW